MPPRRRATAAPPAPDPAESLRAALAADDLPRAADAALDLGPTARALLPEALRPGFDAIRTAFTHYEAGRDEEAREALQTVGLTSPFLEWKLLLRGLIACAASDDARALDNWSRLRPDRRPAHLVAPLRYALDPEFRRTQPASAQVKLQTQGDRLLGGLAPRLRELQRLLVRSGRMGDAFRQLEALLPELRRKRPDLEPRLANCCYWAIVQHGEAEDIAHYRQLFGAPADDPALARLEALEAEDRQAFAAAQKHWQRFEKSLADLPALPPADRNRARALVWCRIGRNAAAPPPPPSPFGPPRARKPATAADAHFRKAIELAPDLLEAHAQFFEFWRDRDKPAQALAAGRTLLEHFPDHGPTLEALADLSLVEGDAEAALDFARRALAGNPLDRMLRARVATAHRIRARSRAAAGDFDTGRADLDAALALIDGRPNVILLAQVAILAFKAGDTDAAEERLRQATAAGARPAVAFAALAEAGRLKLPRPLKQRFERDFTAALAETSFGPAAVGLATVLIDQKNAAGTYVGQKAHAAKAQKFIEFALAANPAEDELTQLCESTNMLGWWTTLRKAAAKGQRRFPRNPFLPYYEALAHMGPKGDRLPAWKVEPLVQKARRLAETAPTDDRLRDLLRNLDAIERALAVVSPFMNVLNDFFEMFDEDDG